MALTKEELLAKAERCSEVLNTTWELVKVIQAQGQQPTMKEIEAIYAALCDLADIQKAIIARFP